MYKTIQEHKGITLCDYNLCKNETKGNTFIIIRLKEFTEIKLDLCDVHINSIYSSFSFRLEDILSS